MRWRDGGHAVHVRMEAFDDALGTEASELVAVDALDEGAAAAEHTEVRRAQARQDGNRRTFWHRIPLSTIDGPKVAVIGRGRFGEAENWYAPRDSNPEPSD